MILVLWDRIWIRCKHESTHGLIPCVHGNAGKPRENALNPSDLVYATNFIINYTEANAMASFCLAGYQGTKEVTYSSCLH